MKKIVSVSLLVVFAAMAGMSHASDWGPDFSAQMVLTNPDNPNQSKSAEFVSSKGRTRITSSIPRKRAAKQGLGTLQVDIINPYEGVVWRIFPQKGKYYERRGKPVDTLPAPLLPSDSQHPCNTNKDLKCKNLGAENINGRATEKWQIIATIKGAEVVSTLWFDVELGIPIRELVPGKMMRELKNIRLGTQSDQQFQLPSGARKIMPAVK